MIHCDYCHCPSDMWEPLATYRSDKSCEFYSDVSDIAWNIEELTGTNVISFKTLLHKCKSFKKDYPDIPDFSSTVMECYNILVDMGVIKGGLRA